MEIITIEKTATTIIVHDGKLKGAHLKWTAPGIDIYLKGAVAVKHRDRVNFHAMNECLIRHIPLKSLVSHGWA